MGLRRRGLTPSYVHLGNEVEDTHESPRKRVKSVVGYSLHASGRVEGVRNSWVPGSAPRLLRSFSHILQQPFFPFSACSHTRALYSCECPPHRPHPLTG